MSETPDPFSLSMTLVSLRPEPEADRNQPISHVVVTGMHRSGTSAVTQLLGANGCDLGDPAQLIPAEPPNPYGYFENTTLNTLNESLLEELGATWWHPPAAEAVAGAAEDLARRIKPAWREIMKSYTRGTPIVKDPRLSLLMPAWRQVLGQDTLYVVCLRDPLAVARSLLVRNLTDINAGCALWEVYNVGLLHGLNGARALFVDIDELSDDQSARVDLVNLVRSAIDLPATSKLNDTFDAGTLGPRAAPGDLVDVLTGYQLALHRSLKHLPQDIVVIDRLPHLRTSSSALRILAGNYKLATERQGRNAEQLAVEAHLRQQLEIEQSEVRRLVVALRLDEESRERERILRLDAESTRNDLIAARQRIGQLEVEVRQTRDEAERRASAESRAREELRATHDLYAQAFDSRSWRWTKPMRREGRGRPHADGETDDADHHAASSPLLGRRADTPRIGVVVHVFYPELWPPLQEQLANLQIPYDLFVSLTEGHSGHLAESIGRVFPRATIRSFPNVGRDIAPFVEFIRAGDLDGYSAILKLHSKRSHHRGDGAEWRTALWHGLLPNPRDAERFAAIVAHNPDIGCIVPAGNIQTAESIGANAVRVEALLGRLGIDFLLDELVFPAGSMYWLDGSVIEPIRAMFSSAGADFEPELGQVDGTTAHAFERVLGVLLTRRGQAVLESENA